jgi:phosphomethylpyrimidine synthase
MKISQEVREYAAASDAEIAEGMKAKSAEFKAQGGEIYIPIHAV